MRLCEKHNRLHMSLSAPSESLTVLTLLILIGLTSLRGHRSTDFRTRWLFDAEGIRLRREYHRFVTGCGLHADFPHFAFNAITIYLFGTSLALAWGPAWMLIVFFVSVLTGSLLTYWINRYKDHRALGASGGACGLVFAFILTHPGAGVSLGFIPIFMPGWIYAILFIGGSYIAHRRKQDNIGHAAHLGGAVGGALLMMLRSPGLLATAPWTTWLSLILLSGACACLVLLPHGFSKRNLTRGSGDHRPNLRYQRYDELNPDLVNRRRLDALLDKIADDGPDSLSVKERRELDALSLRLRQRRTAIR